MKMFDLNFLFTKQLQIRIKRIFYYLNNSPKFLINQKIFFSGRKVKASSAQCFFCSERHKITADNKPSVFQKRWIVAWQEKTLRLRKLRWILISVWKNCQLLVNDSISRVEWKSLLNFTQKFSNWNLRPGKKQISIGYWQRFTGTRI